jgi:hypothetical protein
VRESPTHLLERRYLSNERLLCLNFSTLTFEHNECYLLSFIENWAETNSLYWTDFYYCYTRVLSHFLVKRRTNSSFESFFKFFKSCFLKANSKESFTLKISKLKIKFILYTVLPEKNLLLLFVIHCYYENNNKDCNYRK